MLYVHSLFGRVEPLVNHETPTRKWILNSDYTLDFGIYRTTINSDAFDLIEFRSLIEYEDNYFRVQQLSNELVSDTEYKQVRCMNVSIYDLGTHRVYSELSGSISITQAMNLITNGTKFTYTLAGDFENVTFEKFGKNKGYELFQDILKKYEAEYEISKYHITLKNRIGSDKDFQFRYKHNITGTIQECEADSMSTYIKGYGKEREEKDILTGTKSALVVDDFDGKWTDPSGTTVSDWNSLGYAVGYGKETNVIGDSFQFKFKGTGFKMDMVCTKWGGKVKFTIDDDKTKVVSVYNSSSIVKTYEIVRGLEDKTHTVDVKLDSRDGKNPNTEGSALPGFAQPTGNIIATYRNRVDAEKYYASAEYLSPRSSIPGIGVLHADEIQDDRFTNEDALLKFIKTQVQDYPLVSHKFDYHDFVNSTGQDIERGDAGYLVHEKLGIDIYTRVVEIEDYPTTNITPVITVGNVIYNGTQEIVLRRRK
ncbi:prophage endopeptidase tail family protein [Peribacillus butanolivorans]|uniref:prophage endopeptidase tail family protein n=1 Tax=Peribacillus butanolivorans TaxID=421767 RepID=UPI002E1A8D48|nr:prophage endopeptidase tail family protein [Peribacillus butanolivorans]